MRSRLSLQSFTGASVPILVLLASGTAAGQVEPLVKTYVEAVGAVNAEHARRPGKVSETVLALRMPRKALAALEGLLKLEDSPALLEGLLACGEAALDLDLLDDFERVRSRLEESSPEHSRRLGIALSRPGFLLRGLGGLKLEYLAEFAAVLDAVIDAYQETFGFEEWSKVPGKKLRVRIHLEEKIDRGPHFAPQFPYHSEVDFPVDDGEAFRSPTPDGKFLFYGLCHELGHAIAMWGDSRREEDHHAWAHYTGVTIVERLSEGSEERPHLKGLGDVRWRSLQGERKRLEGKQPSLSDRDGVLTLLIALHDRVGPAAIGQALNHLDRKDRRLRINRVRYYTFRELKEALVLTAKSPQARKAAAIIPDR